MCAILDPPPVEALNKEVPAGGEGERKEKKSRFKSSRAPTHSYLVRLCLVPLDVIPFLGRNAKVGRWLISDQDEPEQTPDQVRDPGGVEHGLEWR